MEDRNRKIVIVIGVGVIAVMTIISLTLWLLNSSNNRVNPQPADTVKTDPITGEQIITPRGTTPESTSDIGADVPSVIGASKIQPLFGDDLVFSAVKRYILDVHFKDAKFVKISPQNIAKDAVNNQQTKEYYVLVEFDVYLDDNTTNKYRISIKSQRDGLIFGTVTAPDGTATKYETNVYGT